jgi:hypothetical protein
MTLARRGPTGTAVALRPVSRSAGDPLMPCEAPMVDTSRCVPRGPGAVIRPFSHGGNKVYC